MKLTLHKLALPLEHEFTISRGSATMARTLIVELADGDLVGLGEVTENAYYGQTLDQIADNILSVRDLIEQGFWDSAEQLWQNLQPALADQPFALSAVDLAAHDLCARRRGLPLRQAWQLPDGPIVDSSFTIGIDTIPQMVAKLQQKSGWSCYKIKLGTDHDLQIVQALRDVSEAVFRVDANCAWSAATAVEYSHALKNLGVEFIEQPLPADAADADRRFVFAESALPVIADESCLTETDVDRCQQFFHGVNIKLCKCGGLTPALRMLRRARHLGLQTMVGCMVESSVGISAAAQLLPLLDYADLDGAALLKDEPARGVTIDHGRVGLSSEAGTGARLLHHRLDEFRV